MANHLFGRGPDHPPFIGLPNEIVADGAQHDWIPVDASLLRKAHRFCQILLCEAHRGFSHALEAARYHFVQNVESAL